MKVCRCAEFGYIPDDLFPICNDYVPAYLEGGECFHCGHQGGCHPRPISIWRYEDAPSIYQKLAKKSSWIIFVPNSADKLLELDKVAEIEDGALYVA